MNNKNSNYKEYVYPVVILTLICLVTTFLLAMTNSVSYPIIVANKAASADRTRQELLAEADSFTDISADLGTLSQSTDGSAHVDNVFKANNGAGYVMTVGTKSFGGELTMMVGMDENGAITGVKVTDHSDTPGIGSKDQTPEYLSQYSGLTELTNEDVKKESSVTAAGSGFAYIAGASVSGTAIHKGVYAALDQYKQIGGVQ